MEVGGSHKGGQGPKRRKRGGGGRGARRGGTLGEGKKDAWWMQTDAKDEDTQRPRLRVVLCFNPRNTTAAALCACDTVTVEHAAAFTVNTQSRLSERKISIYKDFHR